MQTKRMKKREVSIPFHESKKKFMFLLLWVYSKIFILYQYIP